MTTALDTITGPDTPVPFWLTEKAIAALAPADPEPMPLPALDTITGRAASAPDGYWVPFLDGIWIPWSAPDDDGPGGWDSGRYIKVEDNDWHGTAEPPVALWEFLAHARYDVLALAREVRRLQGLPAAAGAGPGPVDEWACTACGAGWFGTRPDDGRCPGCRSDA